MTQQPDVTGTDIGLRVREIVGEMSPLGRREAQPTDRMTDDLGYDSLAVVELAFALEKEFDLGRITEEQAVEIVTVADVEALVRRATVPAG